MSIVLLSFKQSGCFYDGRHNLIENSRPKVMLSVSYYHSTFLLQTLWFKISISSGCIDSILLVHLKQYQK